MDQRVLMKRRSRHLWVPAIVLDTITNDRGEHYVLRLDDGSIRTVLKSKTVPLPASATPSGAKATNEDPA